MKDSLNELDTTGTEKCILMRQNDSTTGYHPEVADCSEPNSFICEIGE